MLVQRAIDEPGENFLRETIDNVPFQFDEEQDGVAWIDGLDGEVGCGSRGNTVAGRADVVSPRLPQEVCSSLISCQRLWRMKPTTALT